MTYKWIFPLCLGNDKTEQVIMRLSPELFSQFKNMQVYLYYTEQDSGPV